MFMQVSAVCFLFGLENDFINLVHEAAISRATAETTLFGKYRNKFINFLTAN